MLKRLGVLFALILMAISFLSAETVELLNSKLEVKIGEPAQIRIKVNIPDSLHATLQEDYFYVDVDSISGILAGKTIYPEGTKNENGDIQYKGSIELLKDMQISDKVKPGEYQLKVKVGYQFCFDTGSCLLPEEVELILPVTVLPAAGIGFADLIKFILLAFIGGIILNVMPCVLPVLSIKALSIVKQSHQDKKDILKHSLAYMFGILTSFLVLSIVVIIIKLSGELVGWGFQFQNPTFVIVLYSVIFVFALSMFDLLVFQAPGMGMAYQASSKSGFAGSFLSGIFAVVLATPCTAPFLGAALGFAFTQTPLIILTIFLTVGLGLAFPFLMIGFFPSSIKVFPKPGNWMNIFKEAMGFLLLGTAVWLLNVLYTQLGGQNLIRILFFTVILGLSAWMYGRFVRPENSKKVQWIFTIIAILTIIVGSVFLLNFKESTTIEGSKVSEAHDIWKVFNENEVKALLSEGKPVFIDFYAEWCMTCKANEASVLWSEDVENMFEEKEVVLFRGDYTKKDPLIHQWLKDFKKAGVPLYLLYLPGKSEPIVFPELITKPMMLDALKQIEKSQVKE